MKKLLPALICLGMLPALASPPTATAPTAASTFRVDPVHSSLIFRARYFGSSNFYGRFNDLSGTIRFDEEAPEALEVELTIKTESVDTGNSRRDGHLRNNDFFSAKQFPEITFKSRSVEKAGAGKLRVTGDLTLRGVTKSVTADVEYGGQAPDPRLGGTRAGFDASLTINRDEFGVSYGQGMIAPEVTIHLGLSAVSK